MQFAVRIIVWYTLASVAGGVTTYTTGGRRAATGLESGTIVVFCSIINYGIESTRRTRSTIFFTNVCTTLRASKSNLGHIAPSL